MNPKNNSRNYDIEKRTDYEEIMAEFGIVEIDDVLPKVGDDIFFFRRKIVIAHRDFDKILDLNEENKSWAIISGRGPSNDLHIGHLLVFELILELQKKFGCKFFMPLSDDEKYVFRKIKTLDKESYKLALNNAIDILALGFEPDNVHTYLSSKTARIYSIALDFSVNLTYNTIRAALGLTGEENAGTVFYSCVQAAHILQPTLDYNLPVVVPIGLDQDVYMRLTRDIAGKRKITSPASIYVKYLKGLTGGPMSSSIPETCLFLRDDEKTVKKKIMGAFTGGRTTIKEQKELGGVPEVCTIFDWFEKFFIRDDNELEEIRTKCKSGELICGMDCKPKLVEMIKEYQSKFNAKRKEVINNIQSYFEHEIDPSILEEIKME
ncbi:MAG: tryptophan--tRNA ligase [Candidatus Heimdallarchaeaceae archaeon]